MSETAEGQLHEGGHTLWCGGHPHFGPCRRGRATGTERTDPHAELASLIMGRTTTDAVERVLAAGYTKPRQVTTMEGLEGLAKHTVIRDFDGDVLVADPGPEDMWFRQVDETWPLSAQKVALPATVLYSTVVDQ